MSARVELPAPYEGDNEEFTFTAKPRWPEARCAENGCFNGRALPSWLCSEHELMFWGLHGTTSLADGRLDRYGCVWDPRRNTYI